MSSAQLHLVLVLLVVRRNVDLMRHVSSFREWLKKNTWLHSTLIWATLTATAFRKLIYKHPLHCIALHSLINK